MKSARGACVFGLIGLAAALAWVSLHIAGVADRLERLAKRIAEGLKAGPRT